MTIQECYWEFGGDYQGTLGRLLKEDIIVKNLKRLPELYDFSHLENLLKEKNYSQAFRSTHKIKGVAMNLGLTRLYKACDVFCEELRYEDPQKDIGGMLKDIKNAYEEVCQVIAELDDDEENEES